MNTKRFIGRQLVSDFKKWVFGSVVILLSACSNDLQTNGMLPEGKYPVKITTSIKASVTRSTVDDEDFYYGDKIAIQAVTKTDDNSSAWNNAQTYIYKQDFYSLVPQNVNETHYWISKDETKQIRGWYTPKLSQDSMAIPTSWTVAADQNANDGKGYEESDLLFAPPVEVKYGNDANLTFYHQTAQVIIRIARAGLISQFSQIKAVKIGDGNMALSADYKVPETVDKTYGEWTLKDMGTVIPFKSRYLDNDYRALVIPQNMSGKRFISVTTDKDSTYYYIPSGDDANLQPGKTYTYNITVRNNELEVSVVKSNAWVDSGEFENVKSDVIKSTYKPSDIKFGDYFYREKDGGWGVVDGGLRAVYKDGSYRFADNINIPSDKNYLGIVFYTGDKPIKDNYGLLKNEDFKDGKMHGLVLALWDIDEEGNPASNKDVRWNYGGYHNFYYGEINITDPISTQINLRSEFYYQGYANTIALRKYNKDYERKEGSSYVIPIYAIDEFAKKEDYKAPAKTSGWFFPSYAELSICDEHRTDINYQINMLTSLSVIPFIWAERPSTWNNEYDLTVGNNDTHTCLRPILAF